MPSPITDRADRPDSGLPDERELPPPTKPSVSVQLDEDRMEASLYVGKTGPDTLAPALEDLRAALAEKGVVYGIDEQALRSICRAPEYDQPYTVARGKPETTGKDGYIDYHVQTERVLKPRIREDGTADFKDLGFIQNARKGQALCTLVPPTRGEDGSDVLGNVLPGKLGREPQAPGGAGTELSGDGSRVLAAVDGNVDVRRGVVTVSELMRVSGNVDNSTGNIHFVGDVMVEGDVSAGFEIISEGSIIIRGTVEGATLKAQNDITVSEGVNGQNTGSLIAGGSIKCRYVQNCLIKAYKDIYADTIMYSTLECGGNVELAGKRSALVGGRAFIAGRLTAKTIGTDSHIATEINMCATNLGDNYEIEQMEQEIRQTDAAIVKLVQVITRFEDLAKKGKLDASHAQTIQTVKHNYIELTNKRRQTAAALQELKQVQLEASAERSYIQCKGRIHRGVRLSFGPLVMAVSESFVFSTVRVVEREIRVFPQ